MDAQHPLRSQRRGAIVRPRMRILTLICLAACCQQGHGRSAAFFVPGVAPHSWSVDEKLPLAVKSLESTNTQLPLAYYDFAFCRPKRLRTVAENLGERLEGAALHHAPYPLKMLGSHSCAVLCDNQLSASEAKEFVKLVDRNYDVHLVLDSLPVLHRRNAAVVRGFPVGFRSSEDGRYFLFNHVRLTVRVHSEPDQYDGYRVVGFEVEPVSIDHERKRREDRLSFASQEEFVEIVQAAAEKGIDVSWGEEAFSEAEAKPLDIAQEESTALEEESSAGAPVEVVEVFPAVVEDRTLHDSTNVGAVEAAPALVEDALRAGEGGVVTANPIGQSQVVQPQENTMSAVANAAPLQSGEGVSAVHSNTWPAEISPQPAQQQQLYNAQSQVGAPALVPDLSTVSLASRLSPVQPQRNEASTAFHPLGGVSNGVQDLSAAGQSVLGNGQALQEPVAALEVPSQIAQATGAEAVAAGPGPGPSSGQIWRRLTEAEADQTAGESSCASRRPVNDAYFLMELKRGSSPNPITFTYEVNFEESSIPWGDRWDIYLALEDGEEIHYFSIMNSLLIVLFLTGVVAIIMARTLNNDIQEYNREKLTMEERQEETGWKLLHGDVFRPPSTLPLLLSVCAGTGAQILFVGFAVIILGLAGFLSPANKGGTLTAVIAFFVMSGSVAGYNSAQMYKLMKGKNWRQNIILTATLFPGVVVGLFLILDMFLWGDHAASAIGWETGLYLLSLWIVVAAPLVCVGSWMGFKNPTIELPVKTNQIARVIPPGPHCTDMASLRSWYTHPFLASVLSGILPFGAVCIELFTIMNALWLHQYYYIFGFLFVVALILVATCAEIAIVMCYFQLCREDYRWWWRSFLCCASSGVYMFAYAIWYFLEQLDIQGPIPTMVYFTYMGTLCMIFTLLTGATGFYACLWFVLKIFKELKVD